MCSSDRALLALVLLAGLEVDLRQALGDRAAALVRREQALARRGHRLGRGDELVLELAERRQARVVEIGSAPCWERV